MKNSVLNSFGQGIYTAADAARILKVPYSKANYWFRYYAKHKFATSDFKYHFHVRDIVAVNFLTLIEMYVFYTLKEKGVKTNDIMEAHSVMADFLKTPYPFAKEDIYLNNKALLFSHKDLLISADKKLQTVIVQILKPFLSKIQFNDDRMANRFYPMGKKKTIVVNPENQFGQPVIEGTNILAQTVFLLSEAGESKKSIAKLYDLNIKQVSDAIEFSNAA